MDVLMPIVDGHLATKYIKKEKPDVKIIAVSSDGSKENAQTMLNLGAYKFLAKPVHLSDVHQILDELCNIH